MNVDGLEITSVRWHPERALEGIARAAAAAEEAGAETLLRSASDRAPHATGRLEDSGTVARTEDGATVTYSAPYSPVLRAHPEWNYHGRSGRWLDDAVEADAGHVGDVMAQTVRAEWPG